ncbi:MAG: hypothetical protein SFT92_00910 [Rickettsiales bacterium]|nr:hypothetical protein [Rickettsiales bacterium]
MVKQLDEETPAQVEDRQKRWWRDRHEEQGEVERLARERLQNWGSWARDDGSKKMGADGRDPDDFEPGDFKTDRSRHGGGTGRGGRNGR